MSSTIMQSLTFITSIVSEKIATLKFLPCHKITRPADRPTTDHYLDSQFVVCESIIIIIVIIIIMIIIIIIVIRESVWTCYMILNY